MTEQVNQTRRKTVQAMEERIGVRVPLYRTPECPEGLGGVTLIDYMGNEESLIYAARQSYGDGTKSWRENRGLLRYLIRHAHTSPLEFAEITLQIEAPISVARQLVRHRTASWSELSGRYSILAGQGVYIPPMGRMQKPHTDNKQGSGELLGEPDAEIARGHLLAGSIAAQHAYEGAIHKGLAREVAREVLPVSTMTRWCWKFDLHNLLKTLRLRLAPDAQQETRVAAEAIRDIVSVWVPNVWEAVSDYWLNAVSLSAPEQMAFSRFLQYVAVTTPDWIKEPQANMEAIETFAQAQAQGRGFSIGEAREFGEKVFLLLNGKKAGG